jgi:hypothetical protein
VGGSATNNAVDAGGAGASAPGDGGKREREREREKEDALEVKLKKKVAEMAHELTLEIDRLDAIIGTYLYHN